MSNPTFKQVAGFLADYQRICEKHNVVLISPDDIIRLVQPSPGIINAQVMLLAQAWEMEKTTNDT